MRARPARAAGGAAMSLLSGPRPRLRGAARKGPRKATAAKRDWDVSAVCDGSGLLGAGQGGLRAGLGEPCVAARGRRAARSGRERLGKTWGGLWAGASQPPSVLAQPAPLLVPLPCGG